MELGQIEYFRIIAQTQNISKAAEKLCIAQPSLSQTLKRLENELGTPLFDRNGKHISLNEAGKIFLKYADEIFRSIENAKLEIGEYTNRTETAINISVTSASLLLPEIVGRIRQELPQIKPCIFQSGKEIKDSCDIKIFSSFQPPSKSEILLLKEPLGVVIPQNHKLSEKRRITVRDLSSYSFISLSEKSDLYTIMSYFCEHYNFSPNISMYVDSPAIMRDLLKMNLGIAVIPQYSWYSFYSDTLIFKYISDMPMERYIKLSLNDDKYITSSARHCHDIIISYFEEYSWKFQE